jgi:hypothetical protein
MKSSQGADDVESRGSAKKSAISDALGRSVIQLATYVILFHLHFISESDATFVGKVNLSSIKPFISY